MFKAHLHTLHIVMSFGSYRDFVKADDRFDHFYGNVSIGINLQVEAFLFHGDTIGFCMVFPRFQKESEVAVSIRYSTISRFSDKNSGTNEWLSCLRDGDPAPYQAIPFFS